jgi:hypothetical protein
MIKIVCDVCNAEKIVDTSSHLDVFKITPSIQIPVHIVECDSNGYTDNEGNPVSGRKISFVLCRKCDNAVHQAAFAEIKARMSKGSEREV